MAGGIDERRQSHLTLEPGPALSSRLKRFMGSVSGSLPALAVFGWRRRCELEHASKGAISQVSLIRNGRTELLVLELGLFTSPALYVAILPIIRLMPDVYDRG